MWIVRAPRPPGRKDQALAGSPEKYMESYQLPLRAHMHTHRRTHRTHTDTHTYTHISLNHHSNSLLWDVGCYGDGSTEGLR